MFDLHVHTAPDVQERFGDDVEIVRLYERAGFTGCVLKATTTAPPAEPAPPAAARPSACTARWHSTSTSAA